MTVVDVSHRTNHQAPQLRTVVCSLCGARYGEDFKRFSWHLFSNHTPEDLGLENSRLSITTTQRRGSSA